MAKVYLGIDPGNEGAFAAIYPDGSHKIADMPTRVDTSQRTPHKFISEDDVAEVITQLVPKNIESLAVLEWAQASEQQGVTGAFNYGMGFGICIGALAANNIPRFKVRPVTWMTMVFSGRGEHTKELSCQVAKEFYPSADITLKKHHGRAEALLIAEWGRKNIK